MSHSEFRLTDEVLKDLVFEIGAIAATDYMSAYRALQTKEMSPAMAKHKRETMEECFRWFEQFFGTETALLVVSRLRQKSMQKTPTGKYSRFQINHIKGTSTDGKDN